MAKGHAEWNPKVRDVCLLPLWADRDDNLIGLSHAESTAPRETALISDSPQL